MLKAASSGAASVQSDNGKNRWAHGWSCLFGESISRMHDGGGVSGRGACRRAPTVVLDITYGTLRKRVSRWTQKLEETATLS